MAHIADFSYWRLAWCTNWYIREETLRPACQAKCYPPDLRPALSGVEHRSSKYLNNGIERDHGHLKQCLSAMRDFKQAALAGIIARAHALTWNLRNGFSRLTAPVPSNLRLATAWPQLALAI